MPKNLCQSVLVQDQVPIRLAAAKASIRQLLRGTDRGTAGLGPKITKHTQILVFSTNEEEFLRTYAYHKQKKNNEKVFCTCEIKIISLESNQDQQSSEQSP